MLHWRFGRTHRPHAKGLPAGLAPEVGAQGAAPVAEWARRAVEAERGSVEQVNGREWESRGVGGAGAVAVDGQEAVVGRGEGKAVRGWRNGWGEGGGELVVVVGRRPGRCRGQ
jgi:hypothetical protein